jgi:hypothetical protein
MAATGCYDQEHALSKDASVLSLEEQPSPRSGAGSRLRAMSSTPSRPQGAHCACRKGRLFFPVVGATAATAFPLGAVWGLVSLRIRMRTGPSGGQPHVRRHSTGHVADRLEGSPAFGRRPAQRHHSGGAGDLCERHVLLCARGDGRRGGAGGPCRPRQIPRASPCDQRPERHVRQEVPSRPGVSVSVGGPGSRRREGPRRGA